MATLPGEKPGTETHVFPFYSNDAGTLLFPVAPSTPLPVTGGGTSTNPSVVTGNGTAGTPDTGVLTIQGITNGTPITVNSDAQKSTTFTPTQVTVPATANGILILAANANRLGASISNPSSVTIYISQAPTGLTTSNGFAVPPGSAYNISSPLYTGALYGIVASSTQVVYVSELT